MLNSFLTISGLAQIWSLLLFLYHITTIAIIITTTGYKNDWILRVHFDHSALEPRDVLVHYIMIEVQD